MGGDGKATEVGAQSLAEMLVWHVVLALNDPTSPWQPMASQRVAHSFPLLCSLAQELGKDCSHSQGEGESPGGRT